MPLYEYECQKCKSLIEVVQKFSDKPLTKCRQCGGRLEKLLSAPAIQFKGSGWYVTDYAGRKQESSEEKKGAEDKKDAPAESASKESSTADTKPASKEKAQGKKGDSKKKTGQPVSGD